MLFQSTEKRMMGRMTMPTMARIGRQIAGQLLVLDGGAQRDQAEIKKEENEHRSQSRVPGPEGAPHGLAPQRTGDEARNVNTAPIGAAALAETSASG